MPSGSRLVASRCTPGQRRRIASAVFAHVPIRCSQLSSTIRTAWKARASSRPSRTALPGCSPIPRASEMAEGTASPSKTGAISTSQTPSPDPSSSSAATWRANLVLPAPPAPVSVTRREDPTRPRISASSRSRPMKADSWAGRLFGSAGLPSERSGGNSARRPAACSWTIRSGRPRSFSRWIPRSRSVVPGGSESRTRAAAVSERTTCPPCATAASRAARWTSRPTKPVAVLDASPVYIPIRTRTCSPPGQVHAARARCISIAAATQADRRREHGEERVPLGIHFLTVVIGKTRPDQRVVVGKDPRVLAFPQALQQRRRALDVGEEKRESLHGPSVKGPARRRRDRLELVRKPFAAAPGSAFP